LKGESDIVESIPRRLKPTSFKMVDGTIKIVPFQNRVMNGDTSEFFCALVQNS